MYASQQRLLVKDGRLKDEKGKKVPRGVKVVVVKMEGRQVVARRLDFERRKGEPRAPRIIGKIRQFSRIRRGRPALDS